MEIDTKWLLEETNNLYKKWYLDLERILQDCLNPKHLYGLNQVDTTALVFKAITDIVNDYSLKPLLWTDFNKRFAIFLKSSGDDCYAAIEDFLSYWEGPDATSPIIPKEQRGHRKGQKQIRDPIYKEYKTIWDMFFNSRSENYLSGRDQLLLMKLTLLTYLDYNPDFFKEICKVYKIPSERMLDKKIQKWGASKEQELISCIGTLDTFLNEIPALLKAKPQSEKWFVDYFGSAVKRYVPDYAKYDSKRRKADFKKAVGLFSRFLNGETSKQLEFTRQTYRNFTETIRPKGQIVLLYIAHTLLNGPVDSVEDEITKLVNNIKTKLTCNDPLVAREAIKRLFLEEHPEHDYETIIESVLREK